MPQKKPKKPKHHQKHKPKKKKKLKHHGPHGKPKQKPQKPFHHKKRLSRSGSIPRACRRLIHEPALLDCWLEQNPKVADAIVWQTGPSTSLAWPEWTPTMRSHLRDAWMAARAWHANGMSHYTGTPFEDPPPNQDADSEPATTRTVLDGPTQAWPWYLATVAHSLAAEIEGWVPWSLRGFGDEALEHLLSGRQMFVRDTDDDSSFDSDHPGGYVVSGSSAMEKCTPSHPTFTYRFLVQHQLIDTTPLGTVARALEWCRENLNHYIGAFSAQNAELHWQYRGLPPVKRILEGTPGHPEPKHWTAGCWGTSAFLRSLLRSVNLPVMLRWRGGHTMPWFAGAGRGLSHGDDPYSSIAKADYPAKLLLLNLTTFESWFPFDPGASDAQQEADEATSSSNIGRRVVDLAVTHIGDALVFKYCQDKDSGATHASGKVYEVFENHYTVAQLEATQLWERLAAEAQARGAC